MELRYTRHARRRMQQRGIHEHEVKATLLNYLDLRHDPKGNSIYIGRPNGRRIKVVADTRASTWIVITAGD